MARLFALLWLPLVLVGADDRTIPNVLWHAPAVKTVQDWICGPGGCDLAPTPPFHFVKRETSGSNPKMTVKDVKGRTWSVKFGAEVIPECFGSRFVTGVGYMAEPTYFVARGVVEGAGALHWHGIVTTAGEFRNARFEARDLPDFVFLEKENWSWADNPFLGTRELAGLKLVMMLLSNWDAKDGRFGEDSNNAIIRANWQGKPERFYGVYDWGASLGTWGGSFRRDRSNCAGYASDTPRFVKRQGNALVWGYEGKHTDDIRSGITVEDIRWLLPLLKRITPEQLRAGLKASGATDRQTGCWAGSMEQRIRELEAAAK